MTNSGMPVSTYACRLEVDDESSAESSCTQWRKNQQSNNMLHARFSIVESNQFRELTHLALNLNVGTDKSVRCYLSSRYVFDVARVNNLSILRSNSYIPFISLPTPSTDSVRRCSTTKVSRLSSPNNNVDRIRPNQM